MTALMPTLESAQAVIAYIGLGANLGHAAETLRAALGALGSMPQVCVLAQSSLYGSKPVDATGADYVNAVAKISTTLPPSALLQALQDLEHKAGRLRSFRNAPRTLDLDILYFGTQAIHTEHLQVPHPRMMERAFVLIPLAEVAPALVSMQQLAAVQGQKVWRI